MRNSREWAAKLKPLKRNTVKWNTLSCISKYRIHENIFRARKGSKDREFLGVRKQKRFNERLFQFISNAFDEVLLKIYATTCVNGVDAVYLNFNFSNSESLPQKLINKKIVMKLLSFINFEAYNNHKRTSANETCLDLCNLLLIK